MKIGTLVATLAGGIVIFLLGWLLFGMLLMNYFQANMRQFPGLMKDPPEMISLVLFNFVWAWLIAFVMDHWAHLSGWAEGAKTGAIIMFAISLASSLGYYAFWNIHQTLAPMIVEVLVMTVIGVIAGAVIGLVLDFFNKRTVRAGT